MKICTMSPIEEIKKIVLKKAKFQKVMLLYDNDVSCLEINEIFEVLKGNCIFNKSSMDNIDENEINNGYRLVIFYCCVDSFLRCDFNLSEFINIFFPTQSAFLPYFVSNDCSLNNSESYLIVDMQQCDLAMISSINFNFFYNDLKKLMKGLRPSWNLPVINHITNEYLFELLNKLESGVFFLDLDIIKKQGIEYKHIIVVDLILIDAFLLLILSIKSKQMMLVDIYKSMKDDMKLIQKFYNLYNNEMFTNILLLNFNCIYNYCLKAKQKIKDLMCLVEIEQEEVEIIIEKVKNYAKESDELIAYLYLYNIFSV